MNGKHLYAGSNTTVAAGATLTLRGSGTLAFQEGDVLSGCATDVSGTLIVDGCNTGVVNLKDTSKFQMATGSVSVLNVADSADVNISGGEVGSANDNTDYGLVVNGGTVQLTGGTFHGISALPKATGGLPALLAPGYAYFYDAEGKNVVESTFNGHPLHSTDATLYVLPHTHDFGTTGVCACGVAYVVKLIAEGQETFYTDFLEAYKASSRYSSATLQLLRDVDIGATFIGGATDQQSDNLTLDLNGHTLTGSDSDVLYVGNRRTVILMDSSGNNTGSIKNTSKGPAVSVGNLAKATIESGTYSPYVSVEREGGATLTISGGVFQPDGQMSALACSNGNLGSTATLRDLLPAGKTLAYDPNGTELVDVYAIAQAGENAGAYIATAGGKTVYVVPHTQHSVDTSTGKCGCGYAPVAAVMAGESVAYFDTFDAAVTEAQKTSGSTLTLMQDVTLAENAVIYIASGSFTIDWNGHTLSGSTNMELLTVTQAANLTLMDSKNNAGGVTNSGEICGAAVGFYCDSTGSLTITGGTYSPQVLRKETAYGTMQISGGVFQNPAGSRRSFALYTEKGTLSEMLAPGYAFVYRNDDSVVSSYKVSSTDVYKTVIVGTHEHTLDETGRCNCECGLICEQKDLDENGYCKTCGYTFVARTGVVIRYPFVSRRLFEQGRFNDAVTYILENAPQDSDDWSDLELLSDTVYSGTDAWNRNIDMYLHGHQLTLDSDIVVKSHVLTIKGDQGGTIATNSGALTISGGGMLNVEPNFSGTLNTVVLDSNGNLTVKKGSNPRIGYLELGAGARAILAGGTYKNIINTSGDDITLGSLLYTEYAFQSINGTKNYRYNDEFQNLSDVKVVKCEHGEYIDGYCVYCNAKCGHKAPMDMTDPKCPDCGIPIVASVTFEGDVTYFTSVSAALTQVASCTSESGSAATLALLRSADLTETVTVHGEVPITLDLNGHSLTAQNDAQITLEDLGADFPLVAFIDSNPNTNKSDVTVAVDHVRGGNARSVSVISGHWGTFNVKGHLTMSGGEVDVIDLDAKGAPIRPTAQISAGTVRWLGFDGKSKVTLTGGRYGRIYAAVQSTAFNYTTLLGDGNYAFAFTNVSGENRPPYAIMKDGVGGVPDVEVVECGTDKYPHVYKDADGKPSDTCLYCNYQCKHTQVDETTFTCGECGLTMEASVTQGSETRYFWRYCAAHAYAGDGKNAEAGEVTLKLLKDAECNDTNIQFFSKDVTLDLNGYDITGTSGYSTSVGVTLTLTDSSSGDEAKWGTCGLVIGAGGLKGQISKVVVKSGNWSNLVVNNDTDITMTGGSVTFLEFLGTGAENSTISGGTVGTLRVYNANIKLSGGTFVAITYPKTYTESVATADLLAEKCAFAQKDSQGEWQRLEHKNLPTLGTGGDLRNVTVVQCGTNENPHGYENGVCKYCNYQCPHTDINPVTGKCKTCQYQMVASVTKGYGPIAYYGDFASAMEAATAGGDDGRLLTLLDNASVGGGDWTVPSRVQLTIDLNGKTLTSGTTDSRNISVGTMATLLLTDNTGKGSALVSVSVNVKGGAVAVGSGTWWWNITAQDGGIVNITGGNMLEGSVTQKSGGKVNVTESAADTWIGNLYVIDADKVSLAGGKYGSIKKTEDIPATSIPAKNLLADGYTYANTSGRLGYNAYKGTDFIIPTVTMSSVFVVKCDPHRYNNTGLCIYCNYQCPHTNVDPATGVCGTCNMQFAATVTQNGVTKCYVTLPEAVTAVNSATGTGDITLKLVDGCDLAESLTFTKSVTLDLNGKTITDNKKFLVAGKDVTLTLTDTVENSTASGGRIDGKEGSAIVVESGTWDVITVNGTLQMEGGRVTSLRITDNAGSAVIGNGRVDKLDVANSANVRLTGGFFGEIVSSNGVAPTALLKEDYAFSRDEDGTGKRHYASLNTPDSTTVNAYVVECTSHEYDSDTGFCIYCNDECKHETIGADGKCETCGMQMAATVAQDGKTEYYATLVEAVVAAHSATGSTVKLLTDNVLTEAITSTATMTLDLNGKRLIKRNTAGEFFVEGGTLTLVDSVGGGTAETIRFTFRNESRATLQSGKWGELHCFGLSWFSMEEGEAASIIANCDSFEVRDGKVGYLNVQNKYVALVGGFFGRIASSLTLAEGEKPIPSFQLLGGRHVFQKGDGRVKYADLPSLPGGELTNVSVVECEPHDFAGTNYCIYCHLYCEHEVLDKDTGYCADCENQIYEARIGDSYYPTLEAALAAAAAMGGNPTVTMLCNCGLDATYEVTGAYTLDLNGHELTSEGYTFPLHVKSGTLTIQDSKGTGKVSSEFGNGVKTDKGAMLIVEGGTFGQHRSNGYNGLGLSLAAGSARLRGGTFHSISSVSKLADIVDNGYWYYENDQLYKVGKSNGTNVTLTVKSHIHTYVDGECACGTLAQASVTTTDGTVTYYTTFRQALDAAVANNGCTLTLLDSPKFGGDYEQTSGNFTLDLNGKELEGRGAFWAIRSPASVKFVGDGTVWPTLKLTNAGNGTTDTAFYGGTYYSVLEVRGSTFVKRLGEANHFAFRNDADGTWLNPTSTNVWWYYNLTATAVPYVAVQPANASVSYGADQLPAEMTKLAASFESDWTVSAAWYYKNASGQWVAITDSKPLTSGTAYGAQQFNNTGFIVGQYTLRCDLTATKQGFPEFKVSSNEVTLTVTEAAPTFTAPKAATNLVYNGAAQALVSAGETGDGTLMYSNSQDGTYSADIPTGTDAGTYQVWYKVEGDGNHSDSTPAKLDVTIAKARASSVEIRLTNELTYNGTKQTQNVEIWLGNHNVTDQFEITGNQQTAAGDYILSISAAANGNFDGFESTWWKIAPKNISGATINLGEALTYKGREQTQTVTSVTVDGLDVTYTVSDNVQTNAGTYTLTVTGTGNFTGTATKDWTIAPKDISNAVITLGDTLTYNGQEQTQTVTSVTVDGLSVTYDVTGNTGTDAGDYTLTITGTGNFTGTATKDWTIAPRDISNAIITLGEALTYNGQEQVQTIDSVTVDDLPVTYDASNDRGTNAGAYTLTVTGTGNFTGAATAKFTIAQRKVTITNAAVDTSKVYDGNTSARIAYAGIISNKVANDDVKIVQGTAAYGDKNVGTAKTVAFTGFTLDGSAAANYLLTGQPADTLADITAREITVTVTVKEKTFDGTTDAELASAALNGLVPGDDVKLTGGKPTLTGVTPGKQNVTFEDFVLEGADAGNYHLTNPQPEGVTATVTANSGYLDLTDESDFDGQTDVSIDGDRYPIQEEGEKRYVTLPASCGLLTIYTYVSGDATASHTNYPTSMRVYRILREDTGATVEHIPELDDLLIYNGCSIRVTGKQGIRMITGISKSNKAALTGSGLAGYTLVEYGTVVCWADGLPAGETLTLGKSCARSNFAYRRGVSDPVFAQSGAAMQYTNVLVGFGLDQCSRDLIMRPYITLRDAGGATVTLYGGSVQRSIGYIATQNRTVFPAGTPAYEYVWNIIHAVYGDAYDSDYQG